MATSAGVAFELSDGRKLRILPYAGERQIEQVMALIDAELSEPYTIYTYRYFLNQWPSLCFLAYVDTGEKAEERNGTVLTSTGAEPIGVVIGKLDRHLKGKRHFRGYIGMISVCASLRGMGIAQRLLHVVLAELVAQGAQEVVLETEVDNQASLRLYERFGFVREKRLFNFYLNGKDCFRLIFEIPPSFVQPQLTSTRRMTPTKMSPSLRQGADIL